jgi:hypothetical protein
MPCKRPQTPSVMLSGVRNRSICKFAGSSMLEVAKMLWLAQFRLLVGKLRKRRSNLLYSHQVTGYLSFLDIYQMTT